MQMTVPHPDKRLIDSDPGYQIGSVATSELMQLKELIRAQYLARISAQLGESQAILYKQTDMAFYHHLPAQQGHQSLWPKSQRVLSDEAAISIMKMPFFHSLQAKYGVASVTAEEGIAQAEFYWRIVRPGNHDMGALHADKWFWDINEFQKYPGMQRIKIWIAIETTPLKNGLRVLPNSHRQTHWQYEYQQDCQGKARPLFDESQTQGKMVALPLASGDYVVFHDNLIHGGMANDADQTRVSLEATLLVPEVEEY